jgi:hypothetical protein
MLTNYVNIPLFLISFVIGLCFVYMLGPETKTIYMYPSPTNYAKLQYKDKTEQCFNYKPNETQCPINPFDIKTVPVQSGEII